MTRALPLTQRQAQALLRAAEAERGVIEVKIGEAVIRLVPAHLAQPKAQVDANRDPASFATLDEYLAWRDAVGEGHR
jgi:hypothetical protein